MNRHLSGGVRLALGATAVLTIPGAQPSALPAEPEQTVVMSGLDNPRGLAMGPEGALYVAEAGRGGPGPCVVLNGPPLPACYGPTGAVSRLWHGHQRRVLTGLPSHIRSSGETSGPHDVSFHGWLGGYVTIGLGGTPTQRAAFGPGGRMFGTLVHAFPFGSPHIVADLAAYEASNNPDGGAVDSNPFGLLIQPFSALVADAGGNAVVRLGVFSGASPFAVLPRLPGPTPAGIDPVPTSITKGRDGAYYIGQLTGVPFAAGAASVYRVVPGGNPTVFLSGFKTIIDLDFGPDGSLYVLEHAGGPVFFGAPGRVVRIEPNGTRTFPVVNLTRPTSVLVDCRGTLYVTNHGVEVGTGEVIRVRGIAGAHGSWRRDGC